MARINLIILSVCVLLAACSYSKTPPVSDSTVKTTVLVDGKKDSVVNNQQRNYGNATVSDACVKCLVQVIRKSDSYKKMVVPSSTTDVLYSVDWITSGTPGRVNGTTISSGMQISVVQKINSGRLNLGTYLYNNSTSRLYLLSKDVEDQGTAIALDSTSVIKIRRSCFWGVASDR